MEEAEKPAAETQTETPQPETVSTAITEEQLSNYRETLRSQQNLAFSIAACIITCLGGAALWAAVTYATEYQIGYMAIAIGFIVGFANKFAGKGIDQIYGILGAVAAVLSCALGNYFSIVAFAAHETNVGFFEMLAAVDFSLAIDAMKEAFSPMDVLFYGLAGYEGYKFSFRTITEEEVQAAATTA